MEDRLEGTSARRVKGQLESQCHWLVRDDEGHKGTGGVNGEAGVDLKDNEGFPPIRLGDWLDMSSEGDSGFYLN